MHKKFAKDYYKSNRRANPQQMSKTPYSSSHTSTSHLGQLTLAERTLLADHRGCFKCHRFYVPHRSKDCPDGPLEASSYKTLTEADTIATKPARNDRAMKPVTAIAPVAAVMPSFVLEEASDSDDEMCVAPFETNHLIWPCLLAGPSSPSFEHVDTLIDHRSHLVLINDDIMTKLGL